METIKVETDVDPLGETESLSTEHTIDPLLIKEEPWEEEEADTLTFVVTTSENQQPSLQPKEEPKYEATEHTINFTDEIQSLEEEISKENKEIVSNLHRKTKETYSVKFEHLRNDSYFDKPPCSGGSKDVIDAKVITKREIKEDVKHEDDDEKKILPDGQSFTFAGDVGLSGEEDVNITHSHELQSVVDILEDSSYKYGNSCRSFTNSDLLMEHSYLETEKYKCDRCDKVFNNTYDLTRHSVTHKKRFACHYCGKKLETYADLMAHSVSHNLDHPYDCQECGKRFNKLYLLKAHSISHTEDRPHVCQECGKGFKTLSNLQTHSISHNEDRPYVCQDCGKGFKTWSNLKCHSISHNEDRPHICHECGKRFKNASTLTVHTLCHKEDQTYICHDCGKKFKVKKYLKSHVLIHTKSTQYI